MLASVGLLVPMIGVVGIIIAIIVGLLLALGVAIVLTSSRGGGGRGGGATPTAPAWEQTRQDLLDLMNGLDSDEGPTVAQCAEIRALLQQLKDQGAPATTTDPLTLAIEQLCSP